MNHHLDTFQVPPKLHISERVLIAAQRNDDILLAVIDDNYGRGYRDICDPFADTMRTIANEIRAVAKLAKAGDTKARETLFISLLMFVSQEEMAFVQKMSEFAQEEKLTRQSA